jgi:hypothetical protein
MGPLYDVKVKIRPLWQPSNALSSCCGYWGDHYIGPSPHRAPYRAETKPASMWIWYLYLTGI